MWGASIIASLSNSTAKNRERKTENNHSTIKSEINPKLSRKELLKVGKNIILFAIGAAIFITCVFMLPKLLDSVIEQLQNIQNMR